jgi:hypothetical protein
MKNGTHVRLADNRTGVVVGSGIDGLTIHLDEGRITHELAKNVTEIPPPAPVDPPPPRRTAQHITSNHAEPPPQHVVIPPGVSVMHDGKWPNTNNTWPLGSKSAVAIIPASEK